MIAKLHSLLDAERAALVAADFDPLAGFVAEKEQLLAALEQDAPAPEVVLPLRKKMDENLALLAAAIKGVSAAGERLAALQTVQNGLRIYDDAGRMADVRTSHPSLEKKA